MLTLLDLFTLLLLAPTTHFPHLTQGASSTDPCREARTLEPIITVGLIHETGGFCPTTPTSSKQCCSANAWTTLFPQSWTRLANVFNTKLVSMEVGLRRGMEEVKALNCPSGSALQATTLSALSQLGTSKWIELLNNTTSPECRLKVVQSVICPGTCDPNMPLKLPCRNLCLNTLRGCVKDLVPLAVPWKRVLGSVRTAVRMLATPVSSQCSNPSAVDSLLHLLTSWREPLRWLDNGCEELPQETCYNGRDVSFYTKEVANLDSSSNPEFPFSEIPAGVALNSDVQQFLALIESVDSDLSHHWPRAADSDTGTSGQLLSDEFGSGDGEIPSSRRFFTTDDEDLLDSSEFGSGSGDGEGEEGDFGRINTPDEDDDDLLESSSSTESTATPTHQAPLPAQPPGRDVAPPHPPSAASALSVTVSLVLLSGATFLSSSLPRILSSRSW